MSLLMLSIKWHLTFEGVTEMIPPIRKMTAQTCRSVGQVVVAGEEALWGRTLAGTAGGSSCCGYRLIPLKERERLGTR